MKDTTDEQTVFPLNKAQSEGIMREVERLAQTSTPPPRRPANPYGDTDGRSGRV